MCTVIDMSCAHDHQWRATGRTKVKQLRLEEEGDGIDAHFSFRLGSQVHVWVLFTCISRLNKNIYSITIFYNG